MDMLSKSERTVIGRVVYPAIYSDGEDVYYVVYPQWNTNAGKENSFHIVPFDMQSPGEAWSGMYHQPDGSINISRGSKRYVIKPLPANVSIAVANRWA